jgi:hypothetical protein
MKPLAALAAFLAVAVLVAPADARSVSKLRQVNRGHAAQAQVVCAAPQVVLQQQAYVAPQIAAAQMFVYPAPQQVFLPQVAAVYAPPQQQVIVQPQVVAQPQVVYAQPQAQIVGGGRQVFKSRQVIRGNAAAQAVILPY